MGYAGGKYAYICRSPCKCQEEIARKALRVFSVEDSVFPGLQLWNWQIFLKETSKALSSGSCFLRIYAPAHARIINTERLARRGISLIPNDVLSSASPVRGTIATLIPMESAALSTPSSPFLPEIVRLQGHTPAEITPVAVQGRCE